jgi:hypothetical protein
MKFFKNRGVALVLCLLIVLGSTLLNTHMKFGGMCRELTDAFYGEGGIAPDLEIIQDEAKVLAAIGQANGLDVSALRTATDNMQGMLSQRSVGAAELYRYYDALDREVKTVSLQLVAKGCPVDAERFTACLSAITAAQERIRVSGYNARVRDFLQENDRFPTGLLAKLAGVSMPEEFA